MKTYTSTQVNKILRRLSECDLICLEDEYQKITKNVAKDSPELKDLIGYKIKFECDGDHRHDGQMVTYTFTFMSPDKVETVFSTDMCLMIGWNHHYAVTIK